MEVEDAKRWIADLERRFSRDKVRFAFGKPDGCHSGVWSALGRKGDYYIGARSIFSSTKISLHRSGICRLALTEKHFKLLAERGLAQPEDRPFVKWRRPPAPQIGAALAVVLVFPSPYMTLAEPVSSTRKPVLTFEAARDGMAAEVGFFYSREDASSLEAKFLDIGKPILRTDLDNGESVWIVVREAAFDPAVIPSVDQFNGTGGRLLDPDFPIGIERPNLTAMLWNTPKNGEPLRIIEISGLSLTRNR
jgi:hypothetical protein